MNGKGYANKRSLPNLRHYLGIYLAGLDKTMRNRGQNS
jgi:hypothetical protein